MKKAIIFDLDGTVIDSPLQKLPSKAIVNIIDRLKDKYYFCAATGRAWSFAKPVLQALNLRNPCIVSAGTQICDPVSGKIMWQKVLEEKSLYKAIEILNQYPKYKLLQNDSTEKDYLYGGVFPKNFIAQTPVYFLEQIFVPDAVAKEVYAKMNKIEGITCVMVVAQKPSCRDLHIINSSATKEHTIAQLLKLMNIKKGNTIGIGDGYNDVHLFNAVNYKIAMGNSVPELKEMADEIIGSVKKDGMTEYLQSLLA